ncbi:MAG: hypothetical protein ACJAYC_003348 [Halieaceae bacterium]|jgi:hypothetical protein
MMWWAALGEGLSDTKLKEFDKDYSAFRESTYVNCWSLSPDESYALWKIYWDGRGSGVAIRSTVSRVQKALSISERTIFDGKVRYSNFERDLLSLDQMVMTKLPVYKYESEYRLFYVQSISEEMQGQGFFSSLVPSTLEKNRVDVDLEELVDRIVISPFAPSWLSGVIRQVVGEFAPFLVSKIDNSAIEFTER